VNHIDNVAIVPAIDREGWLRFITHAETFKATVDHLIEQIASLPPGEELTSDEAISTYQQQAVDLGLDVRRMLVRIKEAQDEISRSLKHAITKINDIVAKIRDPLEAGQVTIKARIAEYIDVLHLHQIIRKEPLYTETTVRGTSGGKVQLRTVWVWQVEDEKLVPDVWWQLNEQAISAAVKGGIRHIPGIHIYEKTESAFYSGGSDEDTSRIGSRVPRKGIGRGGFGSGNEGQAQSAIEKVEKPSKK